MLPVRIELVLEVGPIDAADLNPADPPHHSGGLGTPGKLHPESRFVSVIMQFRQIGGAENSRGDVVKGAHPHKILIQSPGLGNDAKGLGLGKYPAVIVAAHPKIVLGGNRHIHTVILRKVCFESIRLPPEAFEAVVGIHKGNPAPVFRNDHVLVSRAQGLYMILRRHGR